MPENPSRNTRSPAPSASSPSPMAMSRAPRPRPQRVNRPSTSLADSPRSRPRRSEDVGGSSVQATAAISSRSSGIPPGTSARASLMHPSIAAPSDTNGEGPIPESRPRERWFGPAELRERPEDCGATPNPPETKAYGTDDPAPARWPKDAYRPQQ